MQATAPGKEIAVRQFVSSIHHILIRSGISCVLFA